MKKVIAIANNKDYVPLITLAATIIKTSIMKLANQAGKHRAYK